MTAIITLVDTDHICNALGAILFEISAKIHMHPFLSTAADGKLHFASKTSVEGPK